jgi:hypothetical protein
MGPYPLKCQCVSGKYLNKDTDICETLLKIGEKCLQADSCENGYCFGSPLRCKTFDQSSELCREDRSFSDSSKTSITIPKKLRKTKSGFATFNIGFL